MSGMIELLLYWLVSLVKSRRRLQAENLVVRHQLNILRRQVPQRIRLSNVDRLCSVWLYRLCPAVKDALAIVRLETLIRRHRREFKSFWRWKARSGDGRLATPPEIPGEIPGRIRDLIREMSRVNCLWGAPWIHGELLKLGIGISESTVAKYKAKRPRRLGQSWSTFLRNPADGICAVGLLVVPTISWSSPARPASISAASVAGNVATTFKVGMTMLSIRRESSTIATTSTTDQGLDRLECRRAWRAVGSG